MLPLLNSMIQGAGESPFVSFTQEVVIPWKVYTTSYLEKPVGANYADIEVYGHGGEAQTGSDGSGGTFVAGGQGGSYGKMFASLSGVDRLFLRHYNNSIQTSVDILALYGSNNNVAGGFLNSYPGSSTTAGTMSYSTFITANGGQDYYSGWDYDIGNGGRPGGGAAGPNLNKSQALNGGSPGSGISTGGAPGGVGLGGAGGTPASPNGNDYGGGAAAYFSGGIWRTGTPGKALVRVKWVAL